MKSLNTVLLVFLFFASTACMSQKVKERFSVVVPSIDQEATSIWRTINDISFFRQQGYTVNLPQDPLIDSLIRKSENKAFGSEDFPVIFQLLESKVYDKGDYDLALEKVTEQKELINDLIQQIETEKSSWDYNFKLFENYEVVFTLYGSGGSYDPNSGTITLFTNKEGGFKNYKNPANTIIHEMVHIGLEESIVQGHQLSHGDKERVIDRFVFLKFGDRLPAYKVQNMGDTKIDELLRDKDDLKQLDSILEKL